MAHTVFPYYIDQPGWEVPTDVNYFAYGSNMNWPQMQRRCPSSRFVCVGRLTGHLFGITRHSRLRDCGTANVFPAAGKEVWGIVYDISDADLLILDGFEDGYRRETRSVYPAESGTPPLDALVYVAAIEENVPRPNAEYCRLIIEGATYWKLPPSYLALLEAMSSEPPSAPTQTDFHRRTLDLP